MSGHARENFFQLDIKDRSAISIHSSFFLNTALLVRAFAHGAMGRRIDPSWGGPIELFLVPASASQLV